MMLKVAPQHGVAAKQVTVGGLVGLSPRLWRLLSQDLSASMSLSVVYVVTTLVAFAGCDTPINSSQLPDREQTDQRIIETALNAYVASRAQPDGNRQYLVPRHTTVFSRYDDVNDWLARSEKEGRPNERVKSTLREFVRAPKKSVRISDRSLFSFPFRLISPEEEAWLLDDPDSIGWDQTFSKTPPTEGLLQISTPVIDSTGRLAIAYIVWVGGQNVAEGSLLVLTKPKNTWLVQDEIALWDA